MLWDGRRSKAVVASGALQRKDEACSVSENYSFSTETSVALITANTVSPSLSFIRFTEPVVMIDVTVPAAVRITTSETTLSETIFSMVPCNRFRMLVLMVVTLTLKVVRFLAIAPFKQQGLYYLPSAALRALVAC
jgi:hypothetical protein